MNVRRAAGHRTPRQTVSRKSRSTSSARSTTSCPSSGAIDRRYQASGFGAGPATFVPSPVYFEPWHGHWNRCVSRSGLPPTVGRLRAATALRRARCSRGACTRPRSRGTCCRRGRRTAARRAGTSGRRDTPTAGPSLTVVGASYDTFGTSERSDAAAWCASAHDAGAGAELQRNSRRSCRASRRAVGHSWSLLGGSRVQRSVIENFSIVIASVGQRIAHRPHRMQRSSSFTIAAAAARPPARALSSAARVAASRSSDPRTARSRGSTPGRRPRTGCTARTSRGRRSSGRGRRGSAPPGARAAARS